MIGIIGAGISGLSLAYHLQKKGIDYLLLEASHEPGGYIKSTRQGNYLFDLGPNSILADQELSDLFIELNLSQELLPSNPVSKHRFIYKNGTYRQLPSSPPGLLFNTFFSFSAKLALWKELSVESTSPENETLSQFFERRFGKEIVDYALNPFVSGIYAGDPEQLLVHKTFPQLVEFEKQYGSVIKGMMKNNTGGRRQSLNFKEGMQTLPRRMAEGLAIEYNAPVTGIVRSGNGFSVKTRTDSYRFDQLVMTVPAFQAADLLRVIEPGFAAILDKVYYPPMTVVHSIFKKSQIGFDLDGFGGLHPKCENRFSAGAIWTSSTFNGRCPDDEVMMTSFVGGTLYAAHAVQPDAELLHNLNKELGSIYKISGQPLQQRITRWEQAIPQYNLHINKVYEAASKLEKTNLLICANWKDGVSLADCIKKGKTLAEKLAAARP